MYARRIPVTRRSCSRQTDGRKIEKNHEKHLVKRFVRPGLEFRWHYKRNVSTKALPVAP